MLVLVELKAAGTEMTRRHLALPVLGASAQRGHFAVPRTRYSYPRRSASAGSRHGTGAVFLAGVVPLDGKVMPPRYLRP